MSRSITESLTALENARNDIVDALNSKIEGGGIEKTLKISEVAEKINSIEVGGGSGGFNWIENVNLDGQSISEPTIKSDVYIDGDISFNLTFTPKEDGLLISCPYGVNVTPDIGNAYDPPGELKKGTEYKVTGNRSDGAFYALIYKYSNKYGIKYKMINPVDSIIKIVF